jgi:NitT/TauT family transport system substrate-binding protein
VFVRFAGALAVGLALLVGCSSGAPPPPTQAPAQPQPPQAAAATPTTASLRTIKFAGSNAGAGNAPYYLGTELGYFNDQGINFDEVFFPSASEVIPALTRGDVDAAVVGVNPATLNALASNFGIRIVADGGSQPPGYALNVFVKSREVASSINGPADLRGHKIALTPPGVGTASGYMLSRYLAKANLTLNDVDVVPLNFPDQVAALTNHSVDVAQMAEPFAARVIRGGGGELLISGDNVEPNQQVAVVVYTDRFVSSQPDLANKLMVAYLRGVRTYMDAMGVGTDRDRVVSILMQKTDIKDPQVWADMYPPGSNPDGTVNVQSIIDTQTYFQKLGLVQNPVDVPKMVDTSFVQAAVRTLGPAPTPAPPKRA